MFNKTSRGIVDRTKQIIITRTSSESIEKDNENVPCFFAKEKRFLDE